MFTNRIVERIQQFTLYVTFSSTEWVVTVPDLLRTSSHVTIKPNKTFSAYAIF